MTYHASRNRTSHQYFGAEPWHTLTLAYSGYWAFDQVIKGYNVTSNTRPVFLGESIYDGTSLTLTQLRAEAYGTMMNGGIGFAYGHEGVWDLDSSWRTSINATSASDMTRWKNFFSGVDITRLLPDHRSGNTIKMLSAGYGSADSWATSTRYNDNSYGLTYFPNPRNDVSVNLAAFASGTVTLSWWNPANGATTSIGSYPASGTKPLAYPAGFEDALLVARRN